jgi:tRNA A-37 threonylcarbamoyl transferase component Bud32
MEISAEGLEAHAGNLWPELLRAVGQAPTIFHAVVLKRFLAEGASRILLLLKGSAGERFVFKTHFPLDNEKIFRNQIDAQRQAFEQMSTEVGCRVPQILCVDEDSRSLLMEYATGPTVHHALKLELDHRPVVLEKAGAWIGAFHRTTFARQNPVNPDVMLESLAGVTRRVESQDIEVARRDRYLQYAAQVPAMAEAVRGQKTRISSVHGDLHLRNVILARDAVYGIDFTRVHQAPTAHDLSRFLVRFGMYFCTNYRDEGPELFDPGDMDAFYSGYGEEHRDDPALRYLLPMQLLREWRGIPKAKSTRTEYEQRQFRGLQRMARIVFEN